VVRETIYSGFDDWTNLNLATGGWGWHVDAGLAALRLILAGAFDRHPSLQIILGRWGEMLVPFADRADLLSEGNVNLERRVMEYITGNLNVTPGGVLSHRMLRLAMDVLGPDRVMFGDDDPYRGMKGRFGGDGGARALIETAPIDREHKEKLGHLNAERLLGLLPPGAADWRRSCPAPAAAAGSRASGPARRCPPSETAPAPPRASLRGRVRGSPGRTVANPVALNS